MQITVHPKTLVERAQAVGLDVPEVARRAGVAPSTIYRWINAGDPGASLRLVQRVQRVVEREEEERFRSLAPRFLNADLTGAADG